MGIIACMKGSFKLQDILQCPTSEHFHHSTASHWGGSGAFRLVRVWSPRSLFLDCDASSVHIRALICCQTRGLKKCTENDCKASIS